MSLEKMSLAWDEAEIEPLEKLLLLRLADGDVDGDCRMPDIEVLCNFCNASREQTQNALGRLLKNGLVLSDFCADRCVTTYETYPGDHRVSATSPLRLPRELRSAVFCEYCGISELDSGDVFHKDHFVPRSRGGSNHKSNIVQSCASCNVTKSNLLFKTIDDARSFILERRGIR